MDTNQLVIIDHHKPIQLVVERMAIYLQSKIMEAYDEHQQVYYVFFYKDHYLTTAKATQLKRHSYIAQAFKKGIILPANHPFIQMVMSTDHLYKKRTFKQVIEKMENVIPPHELAFLATFFESFIPKKKLFAYIQSLYYEYRRNGQMFKSYRIIQILKDFAPSHSFVKELSNHLDFLKYAKLYQNQSDILFEKDPIFIEKLLFSRMRDETQFEKLSRLLEEKSRWLDLMAIYIQNLSSNDTYFPKLLELLEKHLSKEQKIEVLEVLLNQMPNHRHIPQILLQEYFSLGETNKILHLLSSCNLTLNEFETIEFVHLLEDIDLVDCHEYLEKLPLFFIPFFQFQPKKATEFLHNWIIQLLNKKMYSIKDIYALLSPLKKIREAAPILKKVETMKKLADDPDKQLLLGELYYQFKQYDQAIECFSWEMELKAVDPKPVQWLSKIYNELGMKQEYMAYQKLCIDMQKRA
ncbi:hypothetical protein [Bacillus sp. FJAT-49736]|uniref:tetratricopeptide repeat protein n=1 Tax=Bacillus sp. FJAT-49736 TaxID=2833582 RepID=UPI001BCA658D|nr:hypothetical protein [Bacillus sp. FJAT-49736]MBS4172771.1 hypothetical protein [Bacillus sp. FJAT-49736]